MKIYYIGIACVAVLTALFLIIGNKSEPVGGDVTIPEVEVYANSTKLAGNHVVIKSEKKIVDESSQTLYTNNVTLKTKMTLKVATELNDADALVTIYKGDQLIASGSLNYDFDLSKVLTQGEHTIIVNINFENIEVLTTITYKVVVSKTSGGK